VANSRYHDSSYLFFTLFSVLKEKSLENETTFPNLQLEMVCTNMRKGIISIYTPATTEKKTPGQAQEIMSNKGPNNCLEEPRKPLHTVVATTKKTMKDISFLLQYNIFC
jgi:hypothetical protein